MKILIGFDGSAEAKAMLKDLAAAGLPPKAEALILQVVTPWTQYGTGTEGGIGSWPSQAARKQYEKVLELNLAAARKSAKKAVEALAAEFPDWKIAAEATLDDAAHGIVARAETWKPDLIAVGAQGRSAMGRLLLGSVSEKVLHHAKTDVRIARKRRRGKGPLRLLVGVDGSKGAERAIKELASRNWPKGTLVRVVSVVDPRELEGFLTGAGSDSSSKELAGRTSAWLTGLTESAVRKLAAKGLNASAMVRKGDARQVILKEAKAWKADCLFLGSRGLSGFERFLLGSVSSSVAVHAPCTVEIIRA